MSSGIVDPPTIIHGGTILELTSCHDCQPDHAAKLVGTALKSRY